MTGISYLDDVVNAIVGCTKGCPECWARIVGSRQAANPSLKLTDWQRERMLKFLPTFLPQRLDALKKIPKGSVVGVCFTGDLFDPAVSPAVRHEIFHTLDNHRRRDLSFVFLTKRPERIAPSLEFQVGDFIGEWHASTHPNWFLGVSCRDQGELDAAAPRLRRLAAAGWKTWISLEPLRGPVDLGQQLCSKEACDDYGPENCDANSCPSRWLSGVILGGPSGPKAWPINPDWVRAVRDQCAAAGVPFYFKQWGAHLPDGQLDRLGEAMPTLDGRVHDALPWTLRRGA